MGLCFLSYRQEEHHLRTFVRLTGYGNSSFVILYVAVADAEAETSTLALLCREERVKHTLQVLLGYSRTGIRDNDLYLLFEFDLPRDRRYCTTVLHRLG